MRGGQRHIFYLYPAVRFSTLFWGCVGTHLNNQIVRVFQVNPRRTDICIGKGLATAKALIIQPRVVGDYYITVTGLPDISILWYFKEPYAFPATLFSCALTKTANQKLTESLASRRKQRNQSGSWIGRTCRDSPVIWIALYIPPSLPRFIPEALGATLFQSRFLHITAESADLSCSLSL